MRTPFNRTRIDLDFHRILAFRILCPCFVCAYALALSLMAPHVLDGQMLNLALFLAHCTVESKLVKGTCQKLLRVRSKSLGLGMDMTNRSVIYNRLTRAYGFKLEYL